MILSFIVTMGLLKEQFNLHFVFIQSIDSTLRFSENVGFSRQLYTTRWQLVFVQATPTGYYPKETSKSEFSRLQHWHANCF